MTANLALRGGNRLFRPTMLATCLVVALVPLFLSLGDWQHGKAQAKLARQALLEQRLAGPVLDVHRGGLALAEVEYRPVRLHGAYDPSSSFLLDNQIAYGQAGFAAIAPLRLEGGGVVLVNRGWIGAAGDHGHLPDVPRPLAGPAIKGLAVALPRPGMRLAGASNDGPVHAWIDADELSQRLGEPVADWMLIVDPGAPGAMRVEWPQPAQRVHTNLGYAWQWFGFALAAIAIYVFHGWRRARSGA
ncbi:MAG: SURF1 family protein [Betaproteobacteria bacterium]|nr:SURF1 family protein [Betaproteobacteria bacterium]